MISDGAGYFEKNKKLEQGYPPPIVRYKGHRSH
uniref:Uncharacterized protein n=1 Tax=Setaria italica TaxID=4555 RepID=K3YP32_SETIT